MRTNTRIHSFKDIFRRYKATGVICLTFVLLLPGCASTPDNHPIDTAPVGDTSDHWTYSMNVKADRRTIALFDPVDLVQHEAEPANWYLYDFAFANDLATGRFAMFLTGRDDDFQVRITSAPLSDRELAAAGPRAVMRLRVLNNRLYVGGGNSLPSINNRKRLDPYSSNWIGIANGDYRVSMTALDQSDNTLHDYVFQLERVDSMTEVKHAPGIPQLIYGQQLGIAGINAKGLNFRERCSDVKRTAEWSPLLESQLPLPGAIRRVVVPKSLQERGKARMDKGKNSTIPIVISRNPSEEVLGVYLEPSNWDSDVKTFRGDSTVNSMISCAVQITSVNPGERSFTLTIEPAPIAFDRLPDDLARDLAQQFDQWIRLSGDKAWSFKSAMVQRAVDDRSLVLGVLQYMSLSPKETEQLLVLSNEDRARTLLMRMKEILHNS